MSNNKQIMSWRKLFFITYWLIKDYFLLVLAIGLIFFNILLQLNIIDL